MRKGGEMKMDKAVPGHHTIGLNAMFEAIELPARIADLNPSLSNVDAYDLPHLPLRELASVNTENGDSDRRVVGTRNRAKSEEQRRSWCRI